MAAGCDGSAPRAGYDGAYDASVPAPEFDAHGDPAAPAPDRPDGSWRAHAERDRDRRLGRTLDGNASAMAGTPAPRPAAAAVSADSPTVPPGIPVLDIQVLLDRAGFSPGAVDGRWGENTVKAVFWFQHEEGLDATGRVDSLTYGRLIRQAGGTAALVRYRVRESDLDGRYTAIPPGIYAKAELRCLCYESPAERLAERFHTTRALLERLNPGVSLDRLAPGITLRVPHVRREHGGARDEVARIVVSRKGFYTQALGEDGNIVFHFPSTLGSQYAPSPVGGYRVAAIVPWPRFHFTPDLFHDVPDARPEAVLPPGPNSPIGRVWIELSKPNYGIHGTAAPETIGYVSSHGCVRLTNWDARTLARHIERGTPVEFR